MKIPKLLLFTAVAGSLLAISTNSHAQVMVGDVIGLDFGPTVPTNSFNQIDAPSGAFPNLIRFSDGANTGASVTVAGSFFPNGNDPGDSLVGLTPGDYNVSNITDWVKSGSFPGINSATAWTFTFSNLNDAFTYNLHAVIGGFVRGRETNGQTIQQTGIGAPIAFAPATEQTDPRVANLTGLSSSGGSLAFTVSNIQVGFGGDFTSAAAAVSAARLTVVPEPTTFAMLLGGIGMLALVRRRRS